MQYLFYGIIIFTLVQQFIVHYDKIRTLFGIDKWLDKEDDDEE